jgi:DNA-binding MarR family transcriptional regulator
MPQIRQILQEWEHVLTDDLTEEETEVISQILAKMKEKAAAWMEAH